MKMELLKLSQFKLNLRSLITEVRELREQGYSVSEQVNLLIQKLKQNEEECSRKLMDLQAELALSNELRLKLEKKVYYLQSDNTLLENKQKELKETINNLLQSKEDFLKAYKGSTCEMKRLIESRDRKISVLSEKIDSHLSLFESIEKEAFSIKKVVDEAQHHLSGKEEVVSILKSKVDKVSTFERLFVENIYNLESKLRNCQDELGRKDKVISELEAQLEACKIGNKYESQIQELQKTLTLKEVVIQNLLSEKKTLQFEVGSLGVIVKKIQEAVTSMNEEDRKSFSSVLECQQQCRVNRENVKTWGEGLLHSNREESSHKASPKDAVETSVLSQGYNSTKRPTKEMNNFSPLQSKSSCLDPQSTSYVVSVSAAKMKDNVLVGSIRELWYKSPYAV